MQLNESIMAQSTNYGMGTVIMHKVFGILAKDALRAAEEETIRLEGLLGRFVANSEISRINSSAGIRYDKVSSETYKVLSKAIEFSECCQGCFDITVGPLTDLWKSVKETLKPPEEHRIMQTLSLIDYTALALDPCEMAVCLKREGQSIDLGGIAKGFTADQILKVFEKYGVTSAYTNFGGNVAAVGAKPDGSAWRIGIQHPRKENSLVRAVSVVNKSMVTSGDYGTLPAATAKGIITYSIRKQGIQANQGL